MKQVIKKTQSPGTQAKVGTVTVAELERRKDWPLIVTAVACPVCNAGLGDVCVQVGRREYRPFFEKGNPRSDFHVDRKTEAARVWTKEQHETPTVVSPDVQ